MRRASRALTSELWRELIEKLDQGVIIFNDHGVVIYANDEAAHLLGYTTRDVLELEKEDFLALCQIDRLEGAQFSIMLLEGQLPATPDRTYAVATVHKRLTLCPFTLNLDNDTVTVLLLREISHWREDLISDAIVSPAMQTPLDSAVSYCQMLLSRLDSNEAHPFELADLARIINSSVSRAMTLWAALSQLYHTDPSREGTWDAQPIVLGDALRSALQEVRSTNNNLPKISFDLPDDLPLITGAASQLHIGLSALLQGISARLTRSDQMTLTARQRRHYVQVDLQTVSPTGNVLHGYLLDALPLAIVEQVILRHGGRLWLNPHPSRPSTLSFSLPVWAAGTDESKPAAQAGT
jgi:hypothetical protein